MNSARGGLGTGTGTGPLETAQDAKAMAKRSGKDMDLVMKKVTTLSDSYDGMVKRKEEAVSHYMLAQQRFDEKEKELNDFRLQHEAALRRLEEKKQARKELQEAFNTASKEMGAVLSSTMQHSRKTAYWVKELSGNYHSAELTAQRGYSCSKNGTSPRLQGQDATGPLASARRPFGASGTTSARGGAGAERGAAAV